MSGGQKQRLAIARVVIRKSKIQLYDEATSALDAESEGLVLDCLKNISENKTTITIAHKLKTIYKCDQIFVINNHRVCEQGTFDELVTMQGHFYEINENNM